MNLSKVSEETETINFCCVCNKPEDICWICNDKLDLTTPFKIFKYRTCLECDVTISTYVHAHCEFNYRVEEEIDKYRKELKAKQEKIKELNIKLKKKEIVDISELRDCGIEFKPQSTDGKMIQFSDLIEEEF